MPLERPKELGDKAFFTPEEAAAYAKQELAKPEAPGTRYRRGRIIIWRNTAWTRSQSKIAGNLSNVAGYGSARRAHSSQ